MVYIAIRCLIVVVSFDTYLSTLWDPGPMPLANMVARGDEYQCLMAKFISLMAPNFSAFVAKHSVERYITTICLQVLCEPAT